MKNMTKTLALLLLGVAAGNGAQAQAVWLEPGVPVTIMSETPATGNGTISYQWYRDGNPISGATSESLNITVATANGVNVEFKRGAKSTSCSGYNYSNSITITFCNSLVVGNVCWATANVAQPKMFASIPDMLTPFYQWNRPNTAWAVAGSITGWSTTTISDNAWGSQYIAPGTPPGMPPCPEGWRIPTQPEFTDLINSGYAWVEANNPRATVAGGFFGPRYASCSLPYDMQSCIFLPASGYRSYSKGALTWQGTGGVYWSSTNRDSDAGYDLLFDKSSVKATDYSGHRSALNIRCVQ